MPPYPPSHQFYDPLRPLDEARPEALAPALLFCMELADTEVDRRTGESWQVLYVDVLERRVNKTRADITDRSTRQEAAAILQAHGWQPRPVTNPYAVEEGARPAWIRPSSKS